MTTQDAKNNPQNTSANAQNTSANAQNTSANAQSSPTVRVAPSSGKTSGTTSAQQNQKGQNYRQQGEAARRAMRDAKRNATDVFDGMAPGHGNEIFFGLVGLIAAILIFWIGFWQALVIALLVIAGVAFGQWIDGRPTILDGIKRLFSSHD